MRTTIALLSSMLLASCATTPIPTAESKAASVVLSQEMTLPRSNTGMVVVKRDPGFVGGACAIRATVNGQPLAELRAGEVVTAYLQPGEYVVGANSTSICGGGNAEAAVVLKVGEVRTYRISIDQGMSIRIGPTAY